jgi:hypothetical protein
MSQAQFTTSPAVESLMNKWLKAEQRAKAARATANAYRTAPGRPANTTVKATEETKALARYNAAYDNRTYCALRRAAQDVFDVPERFYLDWSDPRDVAFDDFMNLIIDAALERCGHPYYHGRIIAVCAWSLELDDELAARLDDYLCQFSS